MITPRTPSEPTKSWVRSGPTAAAGPSPGVDHGAVGQGHLEAHHHVLDLSVARRVLPRPPARQPSAHRGQVHRLRPVPEGGALAAQGRLQVGPEGPRPDLGEQRGRVDVGDPGHRAHVEGHAAEHGDAGAAHARSPGRRCDRHPRVVAHGEHVGHLLGVGGAGDGPGSCRHRPAHGPPHGERPPVAAGLGARRVVHRHLGARATQARHERVVDGDSGAVQAFGHLAGGGVDGRRRRGGGGVGRHDVVLTGSRPARAST